MTKIVAAVAAMVGIILIAGTNGALALGIGLVIFAASLVVTSIMERLERIERAVEDMRHHAEAERLNEELTRRPIVGSAPTERKDEPSVRCE